MSRKYEQAIENADGWSDWILPQMQDYKIECCDCGLVHRKEFQIVKVKRVEKNGTVTHLAQPLDPEKYRVLYRAGRDMRATAQRRRHKKKP